MRLVHKRIVAAAVALAVTGTGTAAYLNRSGNIFDPNKYSLNDKLNRNQVNFNDQNNEYSDKNNDDDSGDSEQWQQDSSAQDKLDKDKKPDKSMIFQSKQKENDRPSTIITDKVNDNNDKNDDNSNELVNDGSGDAKDDNTYAVSKTDGSDGTDMTVKKPSSGENTVIINDGSGSNTPDRTDPSAKPSAPSTPTRPGDNGGNTNGDNSGNGGSDDNNSGNDDNNGGDDNKKDDNNNNGGNNNGGNDTPSQPTYDNNYTEKTPEEPDDIYNGILPVKPMPDSGFDDPETDPDTGKVQQPELMVIPLEPSYDIDCVYYGEKIDPWVLMCATNIHIRYNGDFYRITKLDDNFKITDYPETATDTFTAKFSYRLNKNCDWVTEEVTFTPQPYKVVVSDYNHSDTLNFKTEQYPNEGESLNLLSFYGRILDKTKQQYELPGTAITEIFQGWSENNGGKPIYYSYTPSKKGLNALYPLGTAKLPEDFKAVINSCWYDDSTYCYVQTLTEYTGEDRNISVPRGIQTVDMTADVDSVYVPASVFDISDTLKVKSTYSVDKDSSFYASRDGMLFSKDMTKLCAIPYGKHMVSVPETVTSIELDSNNSIKAIILQSGKIPSIDISKLDGATIYVPKNMYIACAKKWIKVLGNNKLVPINGAAEGELFLDGESILSKTENGTVLYGVSENVKGVYAVPEGVTEIAEDAISDSDIEMLILPKSLKRIDSGAISCKEGMKLYFSSDEAPQIADDSFADPDNIETIKIHHDNMESYKAALSSILSEDDERITEDDFEMLKGSGYEYFVENDGATLLKVPENITHFSQDTIRGVPIKAIGNRAFADCADLVSVELGSSVKYLLSGAFDGCDRLEIVISMSDDVIHIANGVFDSCPNLHCAAFNASSAYMGDYIPSSVTASFYSPFDSAGYAQNFSEFITGYFMTVDDNDLAVVYGYYENVLCVMSVESSLSGEMSFMESTVEIAPGAFTYCPNEFTISESSMDALMYIDTYGFMNSGLAGGIQLNNKGIIGDSAFKNCINITSVHYGDSQYLLDIGNNTYAGCTNLKEVTFTDGCFIKTILPSSFESTGIEHFTMPYNLINLSYGAFNDCQSLEDITFVNELPPNISSYNKGFEFTFGYTDGDRKVKVNVPEGCEQSFMDSWFYSYKGYIGLYDLCDRYYIDALWDGKTIEETAADIAADLKDTDAKLRELLGLDPAEYVADEEEINKTLKEVEESYEIW